VGRVDNQVTRMCSTAGVACGVDHPRWRRMMRSRTWRVLRFVVGLGLAALALFALNGQRGELVGATAELAHLRVGWLAAAVVAEAASFTSFGALQRKLLSCGSVKVSLGYATGLCMAAGAISSSLPGGPAFASVYSFRQYRRKGADDAVAGWVLLATLVCAALGLGLLATAGVAVAARQGSTYDLAGVVIAVLLIAAVADAVVWQRRWLARLGIALLRRSRRLVGRPRREAAEVVEELLTRLAEVRLGWRDALVSLLAGFGDWGFDCTALAFSFLAVGAPVPWKGLLLAYGAGMLAANLPITPGGLGVVEGSLTIALVAFGGSELSTVAAVLCYRIVSFWAYLPIGWASWGVIAFDERREARARLDRALVEPVVGVGPPLTMARGSGEQGPISSMPPIGEGPIVAAGLSGSLGAPGLAAPGREGEGGTRMAGR